ncbi:protein STPG4-like [Convolutriloba macropyga]|uniref:protein STPG4-like n=1 Tax=Convolutriloba macropyga TaxID=536237 RepID=UPI003F524293
MQQSLSTPPEGQQSSTLLAARRQHNPNALYQEPVSCRESWWRSELKATPVPGSYTQRGLTDDLERRLCNSSFRSSGRTRAPHSWLPLKGADLMPGQYNYDDFFMTMLKKPALSSLRAPPRQSLVDDNANINVAPGSYSTETVSAIYAEKLPSHHVMFRSVEPRASRVFDPKPGPPPGGYDVPKSPAKHVVKSSFLSSVPRFTRRTTLTPGPGAYGAMSLTPTSKIIKAQMGKNTGLFFTPGTAMT